MAGRLSRLSWPLAGLLLAVLATALLPETPGAPPSAWLLRDAAHGAGVDTRLGTWFSAGLLHWNAAHWAGNALGLGLLVALAWRLRLGMRELLAWLLLAWPLGHALLQLTLHPLPDYAGLSGALHAGVALCSLHLLAQQPRLGALLLLGLLGKLLLEEPWGPVLQPDPRWGGHTLPLAHACGAVAGWGVGGACRLVSRLAANPKRQTLSAAPPKA